jgi:hypothetical protein
VISDPRDESDDEALSWGGDVDPTHVEAGVVAPKPPRASRSRKARVDAADEPSSPDEAPLAGTPETSDERDTEDDADTEDDTDDAHQPLSSVALIAFGILAGAYLLYTVGWFVGVQRSVYLQTAVLDSIALAVRNVLSVAAPALWYGATLWLTRHRAVPVRLLWLLVGAVVLIPWPFVMGS